MKSTASEMQAAGGVAGREPRCRMVNRRNERCPNPAVDPDPGVIQICSKHLSRAIQLVRERVEQARAAGLTLADGHHRKE